MSALKILTFFLLGPKLISATFAVDNSLKSRDGYGMAAYGSAYAPQSYGGSYPVAGADSGGLDIVSDVLIGALAALAGLALLSTLVNTLGAAFAFFIGRKKRDLEGIDSPDIHRQIEQMETLQEFMRSVPDVQVQPQKIMASYLTCSGLADDRNHCLERLACEFQNPQSNFTTVEKSAMAVISDTVLSNKFVPPDFRRKLRKATAQGKKKGDCHFYSCTDYFNGTLVS